MKKAKNRKHNKIAVGLLCAIALSFMTYSYAIASTIFSASDMESKNVEIADIRTEIAELEVEYFALINSVSVSDANVYNMNKIDRVGYAQIDKETRVAYNY